MHHFGLFGFGHFCRKCYWHIRLPVTNVPSEIVTCPSILWVATQWRNLSHSIGMFIQPLLDHFQQPESLLPPYMVASSILGQMHYFQILPYVEAAAVSLELKATKCWSWEGKLIFFRHTSNQTYPSCIQGKHGSSIIVLFLTEPKKSALLNFLIKLLKTLQK